MVAKVKVVKDFPPFQQNGCKLVYHWNGDDENLSGDVLPSVLKRRENRPRLDSISQERWQFRDWHDSGRLMVVKATSAWVAARC